MSELLRPWSNQSSQVMKDQAWRHKEQHQNTKFITQIYNQSVINTNLCCTYFHPFSDNTFTVKVSSLLFPY